MIVSAHGKDSRELCVVVPSTLSRDFTLILVFFYYALEAPRVIPGSLNCERLVNFMTINNIEQECHPRQ